MLVFAWAVQYSQIYTSICFRVDSSRRESGCPLVRPKDVTIVGAYEVIVKFQLLHREAWHAPLKTSRLYPGEPMRTENCITMS